MLFAVAVPSADAATTKGPCVTGTTKPLCTFWDAKAIFISDGDTIRVKVDGKTANIRFTGINAMELHRYSSDPKKRRGECWGLEATSLVERAIKRSKNDVRLSAQKASSATGGRLRRTVWVKSGGHWKDLNRMVMEAGLALWLPNGEEWAHNLEYHTLADQAAAARKGMFNPTGCGQGPDQDLPVQLTVNWDADGADNGNVNGEWVELRNLGARPLPLTGWWFRDSWLNYNAKHIPGYSFPDGSSIPAGGSVVLHMGCGANTATTFYWCQRTTVFENVSSDGHSLGDGGYLFDPQGDLRASMTYPCVGACSDSRQGKLKIDVRPTTPESISVINVSGEPVDLYGSILKLHNYNNRDSYVFGYPFKNGEVLQPGESVQMNPGGVQGRENHLYMELGRGDHVLSDSGNIISLRSQSDNVIACAAWGRYHC